MVSEEKEKHLANVTLFLSKVISTIVADELEAVDITEINLWEEFKSQPYSGFKLNFRLFDKNGYFLGSNNDIHKNKLINNIENLFSLLDGYNASLVSYELSTKSSITIRLNENLEERFLNLLLSDELKTLYNYRELNNELDNKAFTNNKRIKI